MVLPTFAAGQRLTAAALTSLTTALTTLTPISAIKSADESVNNSGTGTTLHNDSELRVTLAASTNYQIDLALLATEAAGTGIDLKTAWTFPTGCTLDLAVTGTHTAWVSGAGAALETEWAAWQNVTSSPSSTISFGTLAGATFSYHVRGTVRVGVNGGTLQLQWAQNTGSASNVTVKAGSSLIAKALSI